MSNLEQSQLETLRAEVARYSDVLLPDGPETLVKFIASKGHHRAGAAACAKAVAETLEHPIWGKPFLNPEAARRPKEAAVRTTLAVFPEIKPEAVDELVLRFGSRLNGKPPGERAEFIREWLDTPEARPHLKSYELSTTERLVHQAVAKFPEVQSRAALVEALLAEPGTKSAVSEEQVVESIARRFDNPLARKWYGVDEPIPATDPRRKPTSTRTADPLVPTSLVR